MSVAINTSPAGALNNQGSWKRRGSDDEDERRGDIKKAKYSWYVTLESESPEPTDEDEESIYTVQGNETEFARDTSDTSTHTWISSSDSEDVSVHVEYELDSHSENENPFRSMSSSCSEPENIVSVEFVTYLNSEGLADNSDDSRSSIDSEIRRADFRICVQCKNPNNNPLFRYCEKCYQLRKTYFPRDRPRRKPRIQKDHLVKKASRSLINNTTTSSLVSSSQELCDMDSGIASGSQCELDIGTGSSQELDVSTPDFLPDSQCSENRSYLPDSQSSECTTLKPNSQSSDCATLVPNSQSSDCTTLMPNSQMSVETTTSTLESQKSDLSIATTATLVSSDRDENDSGQISKELDSDLSIPSSPDSVSNGLDLTKEKMKEYHPESKAVLMKVLSKEQDSSYKSSLYQSQDDSDGKCYICTENPKNGLFVHGNITHMCCCYKCAKKVWAMNDHRCPMCNRKAIQVSKLFRG